MVISAAAANALVVRSDTVRMKRVGAYCRRKPEADHTKTGRESGDPEHREKGRFDNGKTGRIVPADSQAGVVPVLAFRKFHRVTPRVGPGR